MESLSIFFSASGRLAPKPFVLAVLVVYTVSFLAQFLLSSPITARASVIPYVAAKVVAAWAWYALHVKRLRDSGRATSPARAITILYALAIVLLLLVVMASGGMSRTEISDMPAAVAIFAVFLMVFLTWLVIGNPAFGMFGYVFLGALVLISIPVLIAVAYSLWLANRPTAAVTAAPAPPTSPAPPTP